MSTIDIHEAKEHLFRWVEAGCAERAVHHRNGEQGTRQDRSSDWPAPRQMKRIGFLAGKFCVPDDFDGMGQSEIERFFCLSVKTLRIAVDLTMSEHTAARRRECSEAPAAPSTKTHVAVGDLDDRPGGN